MNITVVIPTFNRGDLLRIALQSVAKQTAVERITRVLVSENGRSRESEQVCATFSHLPIDYVYQENQLTVSQHLKWILSQEEHNYVALLCDDDWWDVNHLELALRGLAAHQNCQAYFSNFLYLRDEHSLKVSVYWGLESLHLNKGDFVNYEPRVYEAADISLFAVMITPFHFSAMVCAGSVLRAIVGMFDWSHPTYSDRMLWTILSRHTPIVFNPLATSLIRFHEEMDSRRYSTLEWKEATQEGCRKILEAAQHDGMQVEDRLNEIYRTAPATDAAYVLNQLKGVFYDRELLTWFAGYDKIIEADRQENSWKRKIKLSARNLLLKVYQRV